MAGKGDGNARNSVKLTPRGASKPEIVKRILDAMPEYKANYVFWRYAPECMTCKPAREVFCRLQNRRRVAGAFHRGQLQDVVA